MIYDVWQQYTPSKVVCKETDKSGDEVRFYAPAVFYRGQVEAETLSDALKQSYTIASRPMVKAHG